LASFALFWERAASASDGMGLRGVTAGAVGLANAALVGLDAVTARG